MLGQTPESRQAIRDELFRKAHPQIVAYAMAAGGAGAVPLPVVDVPLVLRPRPECSTRSPNLPATDGPQRMAEIAAALGSASTRLGVRELLKLVPVPGLGERCRPVCGRIDLRPGDRLVSILQPRPRRAKLDVEIIRRLYAAELKQSKLWIAERMRHQTPAKEGTPRIIRGVAKSCDRDWVGCPSQRITTRPIRRCFCKIAAEGISISGATGRAKDLIRLVSEALGLSRNPPSI